MVDFMAMLSIENDFANSRGEMRQTCCAKQRARVFDLFLEDVASMDAVVVAVPYNGIWRTFELGAAARADIHGEAGVLATDQGVGVIWLVVGSSASSAGSGWAINWNASWVCRVASGRRGQDHAVSSKWVAIDVGDVVANHATGPCELELCNRSGQSVVWSDLDGDTNIFLGVGLRERGSRGEHRHAFSVTRDGCIVDVESAAVDESGGSNGDDRRGKGKQHGCAGEDCWELHLDR